ncbi:MAG: hypothetical protein ACQEQC_07240 [Elusimicrobiota bacterium]
MKNKFFVVLLVSFISACGIIRSTGKVKVTDQNRWGEIDPFKYDSITVTAKIKENLVDEKKLDFFCYPRINEIVIESDFSGVYSKERVYFNDNSRKEFLNIISKYQEWSEIVGDEKVELKKEIADLRVNLEYSKYDKDRKEPGKLMAYYIVTTEGKFLNINFFKKAGWSYRKFYKFPALVFNEEQVEKLKNNFKLDNIKENIKKAVKENKESQDSDRNSKEKRKKRAKELKKKLK